MIKATVCVVIEDVIRSTKAKFYQDLRVGDVLLLEVPIRDPGRGRSVYATSVLITNKRDDSKFRDTMTSCVRYLSYFNIKEIE